MLTTTSKYALRALVKLAQIPESQMLSGRELSAQCRIPANYLSKLMLTLRNAGFVDAVRGSSGGYKLSQPAHGIHIIDVVDLFEGINSDPECLLGEDHECTDDLACSAHFQYRAVRLAYIDFLRKTTIASISKKERTKKIKGSELPSEHALL